MQRILRARLTEALDLKKRSFNNILLKDIRKCFRLQNLLTIKDVNNLKLCFNHLNDTRK